jgi:hypothetical protein
MRNIPPQFGRVRPGAIRSLPLAAGETMLPGEVYKLAFTGSASAVQTFRLAPALVPQFVSVKSTGDCHLIFGDVNVPDPTDSNVLLQAGDSWQDFMLLPTDTSFKVKGDGASTGNFYLILSSQ